MADNFAPPQTTGNDILGYKGNAELAGGFDSRGQAVGTAELITPVMDMLKTMQGQQFQKNLAKYNQSIKDRDTGLDMIRDPSLNIDMDVQDKDRPQLEEARQSIIDQWKKNPDLANDPQAYAEFQRSMQGFRQMSASSKSRNLETKRQLQDISKETNPEIRKAMIMHLDGELNNGINHQVQPYFSNPSIDPSIFGEAPLAQVGDTEYKQDENGAYWATKNMQVPASYYVNKYSPQAALVDNAKNLQQWQLIHDNFANSGFANDDNNLQAINQTLAKYNADNHLTSTMPGFANPVAVQEAPGKWTINDSPMQVAMALDIAHSYKNKPTRELAPDYEKMMKGKVDMEKTKAETNKTLLETPVLVDKYRAEAEKLRKEGNQIDAKIAEDKADVSAPAVDALNMFRGIEKWQKYSDPAEIKTKFTPNVIQSLKQVGYVDGMEITPIPITSNYRLALATTQKRKQNEYNAKGEVIKSKEGTGEEVVKPAKVFAIRQPGAPITEAKLVGVDKNGNFVKSIDVNEAPGELIRANANFKTNDKTQKQIDASRDVMSDLLNNKDTQVTKQENKNEADKPRVTVAPTVEKRNNNGVPEVNINGTWKKVIGVDRQGNYVAEQ